MHYRTLCSIHFIFRKPLLNEESIRQLRERQQPTEEALEPCLERGEEIRLKRTAASRKRLDFYIRLAKQVVKLLRLKRYALACVHSSCNVSILAQQTDRPNIDIGYRSGCVVYKSACISAMYYVFLYSCLHRPFFIHSHARTVAARSECLQYQAHNRETSMTRSMATVESKRTPPAVPMRRMSVATSAVRVN